MTAPTVLVEIGFATAASTAAACHVADPARGIVGTAAVGGDFWVSVTSDVRSVEITRGSTRLEGAIIRAEAGTCTIELDNRARAYDSTHLAGPYAGQVTPMRAVRVRATHGGVTRDLWRGFADRWEQRWDGPTDATVTLTATDGTKVLARSGRVPGGPAVGAGELSGDRVHRILDSVGWPTADRLVDDGDHQVAATTLEGDAWSELTDLATAEMAGLWVDAAGRLVWRRGRAPLVDPRSTTSQSTWGDLAPELPVAELTPVDDDTQLVNQVIAARVGGSVVSREDTASIVAHMRSTLEQTDLMLVTDAQVADWAGWVLHQQSTPEFYFGRMVVNPHNGDSVVEDILMGQVLDRDLGDRITVRRRPPGGGAPIDRDGLIRGIRHRITPAEWMTEWTLQSATRWEAMTVADPILGRVGVGGPLAR